MSHFRTVDDPLLPDGLHADYSERMSRELSRRLPSFVARLSGSISQIIGNAGSGKTFLINALFSKKPRILRKLFNRIYYVVPEVSWDSLERSPFMELERSGRVHHDLDALSLLRDEFKANKENDLESCLIIDDFGDSLAEHMRELNSLFIKTRHYKTQVYVLAQHCRQMPKAQRRLVKVWHLFMLPRDDWTAIVTEILGHKSHEWLDSLYNFVYDQPHQFMTINQEYQPPRLFKNGSEITDQIIET